MAKASIYAKAFTEFRKTPEYKGMTKEEREAVHQMAREDYAGLKQRDELEEAGGIVDPAVRALNAFATNIGQATGRAEAVPARLGAIGANLAAGASNVGADMLSAARSLATDIAAGKKIGTGPVQQPLYVASPRLNTAADALDVAAKAKEERAARQFNPPESVSAFNLSLVNAPEYVAGLAGQSIPEMMTSAALSPIAGGVPASSMVFGVPTIRRQDVEAGRRAPVKQIILGTLYGAVEEMSGMSSGRVARFLGLGDAPTKAAAESALRAWFKGTMGEGTEEVFQGRIEKFNEYLNKGMSVPDAAAKTIKDLSTPEGFKQAFEEFFGGVTLGAFFETISAARGNRYAQAKEERAKAATDLEAGKNVAEAKKTIETLDPELAALDREAQAEAQPEKPLLSQDDINAILAANAPATDATRKSAAPVPMFEEEAQQGKPLLSQEDINDILAANAPRLPLATTIAEDPTIDEGIRAARMARKEREATPTLEQSDQAQQLQAAEFVPAPIPRAPTGGTVTIPSQQPGAPRTDLAAQMAETEAEAAPYRAATILEEAIKIGDPDVIESFIALPFAVRQQAAAILESEGVIPPGAGQGFAAIEESQEPADLEIPQTSHAEPAAPAPMIQSPLQPTQARVTLGVEGERFTGEGVKKPSMRATGEAAPDLAVRVKKPAEPAERKPSGAFDYNRLISMAEPHFQVFGKDEAGTPNVDEALIDHRKTIQNTVDKPFDGKAKRETAPPLKAAQARADKEGVPVVVLKLGTASGIPILFRTISMPRGSTRADAQHVQLRQDTRDGKSKVIDGWAFFPKAKPAPVAAEAKSAEPEKPAATKKPGREARKPTVDQVAAALIAVDEMREGDRGKQQYAYTLRAAFPLDKWLDTPQITKRIFRGGKDTKEGVIHTMQQFKKAGLIDTMWTEDGTPKYAWKGTKPEEGLFPESYFENMPTEPEKPAAQAPAPAAPAPKKAMGQDEARAAIDPGNADIYVEKESVSNGDQSRVFIAERAWGELGPAEKDRVQDQAKNNNDPEERQIYRDVMAGKRKITVKTEKKLGNNGYYDNNYLVDTRPVEEVLVELERRPSTIGFSADAKKMLDARRKQAEDVMAAEKKASEDKAIEQRAKQERFFAAVEGVKLKLKKGKVTVAVDGNKKATYDGEYLGDDFHIRRETALIKGKEKKVWVLTHVGTGMKVPAPGGGLWASKSDIITAAKAWVLSGIPTKFGTKNFPKNINDIGKAMQAATRATGWNGDIPAWFENAPEEPAGKTINYAAAEEEVKAAEKKIQEWYPGDYVTATTVSGAREFSGDVSSSVERAGGKVYYITPDGGKNSVEATPVTLIRAGSARTRANEALKRAKAKLPGMGKTNTVESVAAEAAVWAAKGLGKQFSKGVDLVRSGVNQFSAWAKQMVEAFGQNVKKYLREIFNAAVKVAESRRGGVLIQRNKQTQTPEFKRWFGDSKIVDESGNPLVVYHGTDKDFSVFDTTAGKKTEELHGSAALGTFFTKDPEIAEVYTGRYKKSGGVGGNIKPVYLSIKKPYLMPVAEMMALSRIPDAIKRRKQLEKAGYDGIIQADVEGLPDTEMRQIVAFRPEQIKSAIGNVGTFDPRNPNILFSAEYLAAEYAAKGLGAVWDFAVAVAKKAKTFSAFAREMLAKFGDKIKAELRGMWEAAKRVMSSRRGGVVRLSRASIDRATGVTKTASEKQYTEKQALKTRLSKEQKATRMAAIQTMKTAVERFKANEATVVEVKNAVVNAMRAVLGQTQRGRADMLRAIKNAKTWKDHARIANQINKIANQAAATKLRQEIRKELSPAALKKMRDVDEDGQPLKQYLLDFVNGVSTFDPKTFGRVLGYMIRKGRDPKSPENAARLAEMQKQLDAIKAGARTIQDMGVAELDKMVGIIRMVKAGSRLAGKIVLGRRRVEAKKIANKSIEFMNKNPIMKSEENTTPQKGKLRGLTEEGTWGMAEVAELAGPEAKDVLFTAPMMGTNDMKRFSQTEHDRVFAAIRKYGYDPESRRFARWLAELVDVPLSTGAVVKMTRDEMLNLVGLTMDNQNVKYAEKTGYSTRTNSARHVVGTYAGNLSTMEKDVLEAVVESYNVGVREPVNAVSLIIDGIKKIVREDTFFPRRVDKREMLTIPYDEFYKWQAETLDGIGLIKDRVEHKNPLILLGAFAGWMRDIDALSRYVGLAIPLRNIDLLRRMPGFRKTAEATLGKQWDRSIGDRVKAIAGIDETPPGTLARIIKAATKVGAMSKLILNPLSVAKQFGGYLTLKPRLKYGDWWRGVQRSFLPAEIARVRELVNKHSPVLRDRYEGHSIKLLTPIVSESESALDRFDSGALVNKGLEPMKKTDFMVTAAAWIGHELEVSREMPDLRGEEFYKEVAWRTMLSVETTQNPSTVLMQSGAALEGRNDNAARLLTTFRSAPARIASMLTSAVYRYRRGEISAADVAETVMFAGMGNAMWTGVVGTLGAAGLAALAGDDDEDKDGIIAQAFTRAVQDAFSIFYGGEYVEEIATRAKRSIMGQPMRKMQNEGFVMSSVAGLLEGLDLLSRASREKATGEKYESGPRKGMAKWRDTLEQATQRLAFGSPAVFPSRVAAAVFSRFTRQTSPAEAARMVAKEAPDFTEADMSEALDRLEAAGAIQFDTFGDRQKRLRGMISVGKNVVKGKKD